MTILATLLVGAIIGAGLTAWAFTTERRRDPDRDARMFRLGVEAQKDADHLGTSKVHHPAYAGGPVPTRPLVSTSNVVDITDHFRRRGPEPAA